MSDTCGMESITVFIEGDPGEDYADLLSKAMLKAQEKLDGAVIHRTEGECGGVGHMGAAGEEWFLGCGHARCPAIGSKLDGQFTFVRHTV